MVEEAVDVSTMKETVGPEEILLPSVVAEVYLTLILKINKVMLATA